MLISCLLKIAFVHATVKEEVAADQCAGVDHGRGVYGDRSIGYNGPSLWEIQVRRVCKDLTEAGDNTGGGYE